LPTASIHTFSEGDRVSNEKSIPRLRRAPAHRIVAVIGVAALACGEQVQGRPGSAGESTQRAAGTSIAASPDSVTAAREVRATLGQWVGAYLRHDPAALDSILADEWTYSGGGSPTPQTKAGAMAEFRTSTDRYLAVDVEDVNVRVYGSTAIVTGREAVRVASGRDTSTVRLRFTDVYARRGGRWRAVATHSSPIAATR
jgi:ketosteroid isomerase-like protein